MKRQHDVLQNRGLVNNELDTDYLQCCFMVEEKGVSWMQHNSGKKEKVVSSPGTKLDDEEEEFSISDIIDIKIPRLCCDG